MKRLLTCIFVLSVGTCCILTGPGGRLAKQRAEATEENGVLTVFLTGNELGALKPCGCSGGQLGGLDRRLVVFDGAASSSKRLIVDTGGFVEGDSEQDLIKFNILIQAFNLLGYDLVNLSKRDVEIAESLGLLDSISSVFNVISFQSGPEAGFPSSFTKNLLLDERTVSVTVAAFGAESGSVEQINKLFASEPNEQSVNILISSHCDDDVVGAIAEMGIVDCLVCPSESDEAGVVGDPNEGLLAVSVGRYGKYMGSLQIRAAQGGGGLKLDFSAIAVTEDLPQEDRLVELYKNYQQFVKEENLLEKRPRFVLPDGLRYTGSKSCKLCHEYEYEVCSSMAHARAYATLERVGSQYDPECVICHVVGMGYESGFISEDKSREDLRDVGCESCHGPGSEHIRTLGVAVTTEPMLDCVDCHTPEQSADYAGNEELYLEKIVHWREPKAANDVKK
ncbi:MAG: hypothetical protein AMJ43_06725 [Coxiella sp. DG_40]|nr:MAG: hypothetical protein AMJ43_06725 [Coxiella sp. DG_40]